MNLEGPLSMTAMPLVSMRRPNRYAMTMTENQDDFLLVLVASSEEKGFWFFNAAHTFKDIASLSRLGDVSFIGCLGLADDIRGYRDGVAICECELRVYVVPLEKDFMARYICIEVLTTSLCHTGRFVHGRVSFESLLS